MTFNPLRYQPKPIYGTQLFSICNPNKHLATQYGKVTTMAAILFALEGIKGFKAPQVPEECSVDQAFAILMEYIYNFDKLPNSWPASELRIIQVPKITCALIEDELFMFATYHSEKNKYSLPVYYLPWLLQYDKELAELWLGAIGALRELAITPLSELCDGGHFFPELLEFYTPKEWEDKIGAIDKKYKPLFNATKSRYGKNGEVWKIARCMDSVELDKWGLKYLDYKEKKLPAKTDTFRNGIIQMIDMVMSALTTGQTLLDYNHLTELSMSQGAVPVMMFYQVVWQYDKYETCEEAKQPDLMTRIHTIHMLDRAEHCGHSESKLSMRIQPGVPAREPTILLTDILNELFIIASRFADTWFDYNTTTGEAIPKPNLEKLLKTKKS